MSNLTKLQNDVIKLLDKMEKERKEQMTQELKNKIWHIAKVTGYVAVSATLDYLISISTGTTFGIFTGIVNVALVTIRQALKKPEKK